MANVHGALVVFGAQNLTDHAGASAVESCGILRGESERIGALPQSLTGPCRRVEFYWLGAAVSFVSYLYRALSRLRDGASQLWGGRPKRRNLYTFLGESQEADYLRLRGASLKGGSGSLRPIIYTE